jgi:hypothetical protein
MKILEKLFPRRGPPEPLSSIDIQKPGKRSLFRQQFRKHYGISDLNWVNHERKWYLVCHEATAEMLKRYKYLRQIRPKKALPPPKNFRQQKKEKKSLPEPMICYVKPDRTAKCPFCKQDYRNVSGPFPKKVRCRRCQATLQVELLGKK